jgi:hypothetical protein
MSDDDSSILDDETDNDSTILDDETDNDSTILDKKLKKDNEFKKNITPSLIFEKHLYKDYCRPFLKNNKVYTSKPNKIKNYLLNKKIDHIKYINTKIDYISSIINNKNKDNFNMINQLLYKRTVLNKLTLENKESQKDFLDKVKKTRDELKTYIKSLNSILV